MDLFDASFNLTVGFEGGLSTDRNDPGNWTGGKVGSGQLRGSMYGVSAAAYPTLDIASLTLAQAKAIYRANYWLKTRCDLLPPLLAPLMFDAATNNGPTASIHFLQAALGVPQDGLFGTMTLNALTRAVAADVSALAGKFMAQRIWMMTGISSWRSNRGWNDRLANLPFQAAAIAAAQPAANAANLGLAA